MRAVVATLGVLLFAALPAGASASVTVGHSGWFWGSPQPQGQSLWAIDFVGGRGYAAGNPITPIAHRAGARHLSRSCAATGRAP